MAQIGILLKQILTQQKWDKLYVQRDVERIVFLFGFLTGYHVIEIQSNFGQNIKGEEKCFEPSKVSVIKIIKTCFNSRKLVWDIENSKHFPLIEV